MIACQGGNVWEWNDAVISSSRGLRGGDWGSDEYNQTPSARNYGMAGFPSDESSNVGFRVASVPEPRCWGLTILAGGMMLTRRKR